ncbi:N-acetylglucosamine kinase [Flavobacterium sp.]|uniref:N-acetylglucosamine kinase n=1 Tax=Flavobacterium sp. TaxID=239 RepID=UPI0028BE8081|nr:N-acetylglucosamine kinase [Flavobacterium sp.]
MKLIVDSGSTKADWIAMDEQGNIQFTASTLGLNPEVLTKDEVITRINDRFDIAQNKDIVKELYFYGAGCGTDRMKNHLTDILHELFLNAHIEVKEDTYAAVFATTPRGEKAIVSILGTGSNCSYFDGEVLHQKVQSLGYLAMDDCSGNQFGRHLIRAYYFNTMPKELVASFEKEYDLDADAIKHNLYKVPNPNAYLATFAKFLIQNKDHEFIQKIILNDMQNFVDLYIRQFDNCAEVPNHFIGSIAYYLKEELDMVLSKNGMKLGNVFRKPIDGLIHYHSV